MKPVQKNLAGPFCKGVEKENKNVYCKAFYVKRSNKNISAIR